LFPIVKLPSGKISIPQISFDSNANFLQGLRNVATGVVDILLRALVDPARDDDHLYTGHTRRKD
jgi:hypothetical protein